MSENEAKERTERGISIRVICGIATVIAIALSFYAFILASRVGDAQANVAASEKQHLECDEAIDDLLSLLTLDESYEAAGTSLEGRTFVITGSLEHYSNRKDLKAEIEAEGGKVAGSVSAKTDYLITNDPNSGSSKNKAARELGVMIITEEQIMEMLGK